MPLIKIEHITKEVVFGVWKASEDTNFFLHQLPPGFMIGFDSQRFGENRKKEFLASRLLLKQLLNEENAVLEIKENGSVAVVGGRHQVSISHSKEMITVIVGKGISVGIDVEENRDRVKKVMHKFLNEAELISLGNDPELWKIVFCWSAKESIYKMLEQPGLSFRNEINLEIPDNTGNKKISAIIKRNEKEIELAVFFEMIDNFILTYCFNAL